MGATVVFQLGIAIVLALMVDNIRHGAQFFRTVFFFPIVISATALGLLFNVIFQYDIGLINDVLLNKLHVTDKLIDFKGKYSVLVMSIPVIWQYVGYYFVIMLTGLAGISEDVYEAADIDGASGMQKITFITLPLLRNVILTCLTLCLTGALKVFDLPWVMFPNGISGTFLTGSYMYTNAFISQYVGYAAAIAVVIVLIGVILAQLSDIIFKPCEY
jgi:raffinose/stachyose/melibiose transport system permease protein